MLLLSMPSGRGAGVTIVTHGLDGNVDSWIIPMSEAIGSQVGATNFSCFEFYFRLEGNSYVPKSAFLGGVPPLVSTSGEIFVKLDWRQLAGEAYSTTQIAESMVTAMLQTDFVPELGGRSIVELPIHLIGHSRGASLVAEIARLLGARGIWVDHMTTLDPHPLNNDGFDGSCGVACNSANVDGSVRPYQNVLFADNYYQRLSALVYGNPVQFAYNRNLLSLRGGYYCALCIGDYHSNVHLWYHGTIDLGTPLTIDNATITASERQSWWTSYELGGQRAGFFYGGIAGGNRRSIDEPAGAGTGRISDGYNKHWDLGAGVTGNRFALPANNGSWPNIITLQLAGTNFTTLASRVKEYVFAPGMFSQRVTGFYHFGRTTTQKVEISLYLDPVMSPYNPNAVLLSTASHAGTGTNSVAAISVDLDEGLRNVPPGLYRVYAKAADGVLRRYAYAPEGLAVFPALGLKVLGGRGKDEFHFQTVGAANLNVIVQGSPDLRSWAPISTNKLIASSTNVFVGKSDSFDSSSQLRRFYRALYAP